MPGTTDIGNHSNDLVTTIPLPFAYTLYGTTFTSVNLSSNGNAQFTTTAAAAVNVCLPWSDHNATIFPYWSDLRTDAQPGCSEYPGGTCGIYTSLSGSAPNGIFNIEWRTVYWDPISQTQRANFELRLYEGQTRFDVIYGEVFYGNIRATAGTQRNNSCFNQYFCNAVGGPASGGWTFVPVGTPSPTPTATATVTPTATVPPRPTPTPSVCFVIITNRDCGSVINTQPVDFSVNLSDPTDPSSVQPTDFMVNGTPADTYMIFNNSRIVFHFNTSPAVQGLNAMHIPAGAFSCSIGGTPEFTCDFTYQPSTPSPTLTPTPRSSPVSRSRPTPPPRP